MYHFTYAVAIAFALLALTACYHGPNLRNCSDWSTRSIPGCYRGLGLGKPLPITFLRNLRRRNVSSMQRW
jgi:hypothetical protein